MPRIVVPDDFPVVLGGRAAMDRLRSLGDVRYYDCRPEGEPALIERIGEAEVVVNIRAYSKFTRPVFAAARTLRLVSVWGTGTDNIDLPAARDHGVTVTNTPHTATDAIAEHTLALTLAVARKLTALDRAVKQGGWPREFLTLLAGKTLGIVGTGAIGCRMAQISRGIGMRVIAWSFHPSDEKAERFGFRYVALDELLSTADVVSLHVRLSPSTERMIGANELARMKPTAFLVNSARGAVVDHTALVQALAAKRISGAGLDVLPTEPVPADDPILKLDNVLLTPHNAGQSPEVLDRGLDLAVENVAAFLAGRPQNIVAGP